MTVPSVVLRLDIFAVAELRMLLRIARDRSPEGSEERKAAENLLEYLSEQQARQVPLR